jgi:META domain
MVSVENVARRIAVSLVSLTAVLNIGPVRADDGFPFGMVMTMDVAQQPGSKRVPNMEIGDNGEVVLELWCKGGKGQFSVAGNTVIFVAGPLEDRACPAARAQADDDLVAALSEATNWKRQGDFVSFTGAKTLRFHLDTN